MRGAQRSGQRSRNNAATSSARRMFQRAMTLVKALSSICLVILVRPDDTADMAVTVRLRLRAAGPEPARLQQDLGTGVEQEIVVPGRLPVLPDRVSDVRADMLLLLAAKHIHDLTIRADDLIRRRLRTGVGELPGVEAPRQPIRPPSLARHRACGSDTSAAPAPLPARSGVKRQQVDLGVPEHVPMIVVAGQRPGADRDALVGRVGGAVQMVDSEPQCLLCGRVATDLDVAALPAT